MRDLRGRTEAEGVTCRRLGDDIVNGEHAILFAMHQKDEDQIIDSKNWISKSRGLPLKAKKDMDVGGTAGKSHSVTCYEYTNLQAPPYRDKSSGAGVSNASPALPNRPL